MAALPLAEESRGSGEAHPRQHVACFVIFSLISHIFMRSGFSRIRFAPPLVISEEDLMNAVDIIRRCLEDLDTVSFSFPK
jgi:acetylornithine/succinyldiaminopimelate/putrescine aminotransferase